MNYYIFRDENGEIYAWIQTNKALPPPAEQVTKEFFVEHDFYVPPADGAAPPDPVADLQEENRKLRAQVGVLQEQQTFLEDCLLELADEVYA